MRYLANYFAIQSLVVALFVAVLHFLEAFELPQRLLVVFLPAHLLITVLTFVMAAKRQVVRAGNFLLLLMMSVLLLGWFLHDSGGHTNPLISLLLVPLAMSAALLGWQASGIIAIAVIAIYAGLMNFYVPLDDQSMSGHHHHGDNQMAQLHLFGMWITFCLSVLLILGLVIPLATSLRKQREFIAEQREQALQDERLVAMATFAASAAHQMGTPLSTLSVLADDLAHDFKDNEMVQKDIQLMAEQVDLCKTTLHSMMRRADAIRNHEQETVSVESFVQQIKKQFNLLNPAYVLRLKNSFPANIFIKSDETLEQAILNLLDNAARASESNPDMVFERKDDRVCLKIFDTGPGISDSVVEKIGQPYISTREQNEGMGLGLFLSNSTINRLGGRLKMYAADAGSVTEVWLPSVPLEDE